MTTRLHHIGIAVHDLAAAQEELTRLLGYRVRSVVIHDPVQTAHVQFLQLEGDPACVELVTPDGPASKLTGALKRGGGLNHLCYAVDDIEAACRRLSEGGMLIVQEPVAAVAFPGRRIAWLMGGARVLTELVEEGVDRWPS
ncbi:MAG TPA: VOC family protein [Dongiaceae bacterium]|nr:VOC family protein [Dongiaceae bacterium]